MKTISIVLAVVWFGVSAQPVQAVQTELYQEVERGPHHRVIGTVRWETNALDEVTASTNSYTEIATGLHYRDGEQWLASEAKIEILPNNAGAAASKGQHKAIFPPEIKSGIIELQTPDNQWLRSRIWGLSYFDSATGESVLIAEVKESEGQVVGNNVVIYANAFTDLRADIRYTYMLAGFEQDVVLREQPPAPGTFGMNPKTTRLQVLTEFVESPSPSKENRQAGGLVDQSLGFGQMTIGGGKAFSVNAEGDTTGEVPVAKEWTPLEGRDFLIEEVHYEKVAGQLQKLPAAGEYQGASLKRRGTGENVIAGLKKIMPKRYAKTTPKVGIKRMAKATLTPTPGFVMDYVTLTTQTNLTFAGNANYYVSGLVNLTGATIIEGGTVVKYTNHSSAKIDITGTINCQTGPYRPAVFTSKDDNTVGETISGSTGTPTNYYGNGLVVNTTGNTLHNLRVSYAASAVTLNFDAGQINLTNVQFIKCQYPIDSSGKDDNTIVIDNGLFYSSDYVIKGGNDLEVRGNHLTVNQCGKVGYAPIFSTTGDLFLTNSLVVAATNGWGGFGSILDTLVTNSTAFFTNDPGGIFQTVGAGSHYLADNSPYRNAGTTDIDLTLANALRSRTTYPPMVWSNDFTVSTNLVPQAGRDTDMPDLGYHYDPLDYVVSGRTLTNSTLTLTNGVALGTYGNSSTNGILIKSGGKLYSNGSASSLNRIVRYNTVHEQASTNWSSSTVARAVYVNSATGTPQASFSFTHWSVLAGGGEHFRSTLGSSTLSFSFSHCQFSAGIFDSQRCTISLTNCLWERVGVTLDDHRREYLVFVYNNLFRGGTLTLYEEDRTGEPPWQFFDNLFDSTTINQSTELLTNNYNGFVTNCNRLTPNGANDVILTNAPTYRSSALGNYYYPTNDGMLSLLIDVGSRWATNATLYHFTTTTNQVKEASSKVDIGFHYVAVDGNGSPVDTDGDGLADYYEDTNGNGSYAAGDLADWNSADTDGDGVSDGLEVTQGRNPKVAGNVSDSSNLTQLQVHTPLK